MPRHRPWAAIPGPTLHEDRPHTPAHPSPSATRPSQPPMTEERWIEAKPTRTTRKRVSADEIRAAIPSGSFTVNDLQDRSGASAAVLRRVMSEQVDAGRLTRRVSTPAGTGVYARQQRCSCRPRRQRSRAGGGDRVLSLPSWGASRHGPSELAEGLREAGEDMPDEWLDRTAARISKADPAQKNSQAPRTSPNDDAGCARRVPEHSETSAGAGHDGACSEGAP